jgi:hypothetical protein
MKAIEVLVNGTRLCLAGSGPQEFTWAQLTLDERGEAAASLSVAGSRAKTVPIWIDDYRVKAGDEVVLRIVDVEDTDPPVMSPTAWTEFPKVKLDD